MFARALGILGLNVLLMAGAGCSRHEQEPSDFDARARGQLVETACTDGRDDDLDGLIDCIDPECATAAACAATLDCAKAIYQIRENTGEVVVYNTATNPFTFTSIGTLNSQHNAAGYNTRDGHIYAIRNSDRHLVRVDHLSPTSVTGVDLGAVTNLPTGGQFFYAADFDREGSLWVSNGSLYRIDVSASPPVATAVGGAGFAPSDMAYNPDQEKFYGVDGNTLTVFDVPTRTATTRTITGATVSGTGTHGAVWFDADGAMFAYQNSTGYLRRVLLDAMTLSDVPAEFVGTGPTSNQNDGASCPLAGPPFEVCGNGRDDDGDGTVDENGVKTSPNSNSCVDLRDTDADGVPNVDDLDDDNDGIPDVLEEGDTDRDGVPDRLDLDSDNDGVLDVVEAGHDALDGDRDGLLSGAFGANGLLDALETAPDTAQLDYNSDSVGGDSPRDSDADGVPDFQDLDADSDGLSDLVEAGYAPSLDSDDDGVVNDGADADGDGVQDAVDGDTAAYGDDDTAVVVTDTDGDGRPDGIELDSDADGLFDVFEKGPAGLDQNQDGKLDALADSDLDGIADVVDDILPGFGGLGRPDSDGDGLADASDLDDDDDGILDSVEGELDLDRDGLPNRLDLDSDGDGLADVTEAGHTAPASLGRVTCAGGFGTNGLCDALETAADSGTAGYTVRDTDGDGAPDFRDLDSDNDAINDVRESGAPGGVDADGNGLLDPIASGTPDSDGDGLVDRADADDGGAALLPVDSDGDGVPDYRDLDSDQDSVGDLVEGLGSALGDSDDDGVVDGPDGDGDGIRDSVDGRLAEFGDQSDGAPRNSDSTGAPDYLDLDSDGDGTNDIDENAQGAIDADDDGRADAVADADLDGITDGLDDKDAEFGGIRAPSPDSDGDGTKDDVDLDDDNDGILDSVEGSGDFDADGVPNRLDLDSDGDGIADVREAGHGATATDSRLSCPDGTGVNGLCDALEVAADSGSVSYAVAETDGDGAPDFLDLDSDDDGINDVRESGPGGVDEDGDGALDALGVGPGDSDGDGLIDRGDSTAGGVEVIPVDSDGDGRSDYRDLDSDNDTLSDLFESGAGVADSDDNGVVDGADDDDDGIRSSADGAPAAVGDAGDPEPRDSDALAPADYLDLDSDEDGDFDVLEAGNSELDGDADGRVDGNVDADADGILDSIDDSDGDGLPDSNDPGSGAFGGLGAPRGADSDGDGVPDEDDLDDDNDGISDALEGAADSDGDGVSDRLDLDSDNDGIGDAVEAGHGGRDQNGDGTVDGAYGVNGLADALETSPDSGEVSYRDPLDSDDDDRPDFQDLDADNDGITDLVEAGFVVGSTTGAVDADEDGVVDGADPDGDGILASVDGAPSARGDAEANAPERDSDGDGFPDRLDLDSDNDGKDDLREAGLSGLDKNGDGRIDGKTDSDRDGVIDSVDDSDGDGTPDDEDGDAQAFGTGLITLVDSDGDVIADVYDPKGTDRGVGDSDGDGKSDAQECPDPPGFPRCPDGDGDGTPDYAEEADTDGDGLRDSVDLDSDGDGIPNALENLSNLDPSGDADEDGFPNLWDADDRGDGQAPGCEDRSPRNGLCDRLTVLFDADLDGVANHLDLDADDDGLVDAIESGAAGPDENRNGIIDGKRGDNGLADAVETAVDSGRLQLPLLDTDGDRTPDFLDLDSDADGEFDLAEVVALRDLDADGDGRVDGGDDDDGDGIRKAVDARDDQFGYPALGSLFDDDEDDNDRDGIPNPYDVADDGQNAGDSDEDGLTDDLECTGGWPCPDGNADGRPDYMDPDLDRDGIPDGEDDDDDGDTLKDGEENSLGIEPDADADGDGIPNYLDADDRGDGEAAACADENTDGRCDALDPLFDSDGDGRATHRDTDDDNDGLPTKTEVEDGSEFGDDIDEDGKPNWLDTDSDGDTLLDSDEGTTDTDADGVPEYLDPQSSDELDSDGDGSPDSIDPDDDNDTVADVDECPGSQDGECDTDGDGKPNRLDDDDDGDSIPTKTEVTDGRTFGSDVDGDGQVNWRDTDSDGDGLSDTEEKGLDEDSDGVPDYLDDEFLGFSGGACSCRTSPGSGVGGPWGLVAALGVALLAGRRRRNRATVGLALSFAMVAQLLSRPAAAQSVELNQFRPSERADEGFAVSRTNTPGHLKFGAQLYLDYALNPLVVERAQGDASTEAQAIVRDQLSLHAGLSLGLTKHLLLFAGVPVHLLMGGDDAPSTITADGTGIGDVQLGGRARLIGSPDDLFGLALQATVGLPTAQLAREDQQLSGDSSANVIPELLAELRPGGVVIGLNVGARLREQRELVSLGVRTELLYGLGVTVPLKKSYPRLNAHAEVYGASAFDDFPDREQSPLQTLLGMKFLTESGWVMGLAAGPGVGRGYGTPDVRVLAMVGLATFDRPKPALPVPVEPKDSDRDGLVDDVDRCPAEPEDRDAFEDEDGCPDPDNDRDGVLDTADAAPLEPEDRDGFEDQDGVPDPDNDRDTLLDASDRCPNEAEDRDGFEDEDGCPDPDNDRDTVPDASDKCPETPGAPEDEGCPKTVRIEKGRIMILKRVEFATNRDVILPASQPILEDVLKTLQAEDSLLKVRIEGHTDARGRDATNLDLSRRRASSVERWLLERGVDASRLEAWGCGETIPLADNDTDVGRQENRRVEFHIVDPAPPDGPRAPSGCEQAH